MLLDLPRRTNLSNTNSYVRMLTPQSRILDPRIWDREDAVGSRALWKKLVGKCRLYLLRLYCFEMLTYVLLLVVEVAVNGNSLIWRTPE